MVADTEVKDALFVITKAQIHLNLSTCYYCLHQSEGARHHLQLCVCVAWETDFYPSEVHRRSIGTEALAAKLRIGAYTMDMYVSYRFKTAPLIANEAKVGEELNVSESRKAVSLRGRQDLAHQRIRLKGVHLFAKAVALHKKASTEPYNARVLAVQLNKEISCFLQDPRLSLQLMAKTSQGGLLDEAAARLVHMIINARTFVNSMQCHLVESLQLYDRGAIQAATLQSAYETLQCIPSR